MANTTIPLIDRSTHWVLRSRVYGNDHPALSAFITSIRDQPIEVEISELDTTGISHAR